MSRFAATLGHGGMHPFPASNTRRRLFVLGATGHTGTYFLDLALERGHQVTAFVRSPQKIPSRQAKHASLSVVRGDPLDVEQLAKALGGHDVVVSSLGVSMRDSFRPNSFLTECAASTVAAMKSVGLSRLLIVSAAILFPEKSLRYSFFRWFLKHRIPDFDGMETVVRATGFDWTIARPPQLTDSEDTTYDSVRDALPAGSYVSSFRALAAFLIDCVEKDTHLGETVGVARPRRGAA